LWEESFIQNPIDRKRVKTLLLGKIKSRVAGNKAGEPPGKENIVRPDQVEFKPPAIVRQGKIGQPTREI